REPPRRPRGRARARRLQPPPRARDHGRRPRGVLRQARDDRVRGRGHRGHVRRQARLGGALRGRAAPPAHAHGHRGLGARRPARALPRARNRRGGSGLMRGTRLAITLVFLADGLMLGSWAARIPAVQRHAGLTNTQLGVALFAMSLGAMVAMPLAGGLSGRIGRRAVVTAGLVGGSASLFAASLATGLGGLAAALAGFGASFGAVNVAANVQGLALERLYGRPILSSFHAAFSAGGLVGA